VLLGLLTAYLLSRRQFVGRRPFEFATMLNFAIPGTVVGVSYILAFNVPPIELRPGQANPRHLLCVPQDAG
jgi:iron(III) transport system permease protein